MSPPPMPSREVLKEAAQTTHFRTLRKSLLKFIDEADQNTLSMLSNFLANDPSLDEPHHCIRCHNNYTSRTNGDMDCTVQHVFESDCSGIHSTTGYRKNYRYEAVCCTNTIIIAVGGDDFTLDETEPKYCYVGRHTSDAKEVKYKPYSIVKCKVVDGKCIRSGRGGGKYGYWFNEHISSNDMEESEGEEEESSEEDVGGNGGRK